MLCLPLRPIPLYFPKIHSFGIVLLMNITQGKCYSPAEYGAVLTELGFAVGPYQDTVADRGFMSAVKR